MAMTLRLTDELDHEVEELAQANGLSKQQTVTLAIEQFVQRERRRSRTLRNVDRVVRENENLLRRLGE